jgi:hypothetical protein
MLFLLQRFDLQGNIPAIQFRMISAGTCGFKRKILAPDL